MKSETLIVAACIAGLNASGLAVVWRNHSGAVRARGGHMRLAPEGSPDIVGFLRDGRFLGLETKVEGNRTQKDRAEAQGKWRDRIRAAGGVAAEVRSAAEALELVRAALEAA